MLLFGLTCCSFVFYRRDFVIWNSLVPPFFPLPWFGYCIYFLTCRGNFRTIWHYRFNNLSIFILFGFLWERNPHCRKLLIDFFATVDLLLLFLTTHASIMNYFMPLRSLLFFKMSIWHFGGTNFVSEYVWICKQRFCHKVLYRQCK